MKTAVEKIKERLEHLLNNFGEHCEDWGGDCHHRSCSDCVLNHAIEIVNQVAEEFAPDINAGSNDEYITLPKVAFDQMIARIASQGEKDWDGESWFINVNDAARIVFEIVREYQPEPAPQSKEPERPWREAIMRTFLSRGME